MSKLEISDAIKYVGVDDKDIDLFESQYVVPNGIAYNSYVILDESITIMDTVDSVKSEEWLKNLDEVLEGKTPSYVVCLHMEPDHAGSLQCLLNKYPEIKIVGNAKTFVFIKQFFDFELEGRTVEVKEGEALSLGEHSLQFIMAPMIHWPEVMVAYETTEKTLFSADAFGKFGTLDTDEAWDCEARRYYFNIVGKYGVQVQNLLKKASAFDVQRICPLHGEVLQDNIAHYVGKYRIWSSYEPEDRGIFIAYASIHGNTRAAAEKFKEILDREGTTKVSICDLAREDMAEAVEDAFRYDRLVLFAASYDGGVFPCMEEFLHHLQSKNYQKRKIALIENGTWAPSAMKAMKAIIEKMKSIDLCETTITIKSRYSEENLQEMEKLAGELLE